MAYREWRRAHDQKYLDEIQRHLERVMDERRTDPNVLFLSALHTFLKDRNTKKAREYLRGMKKRIADTTDGNLIGAWNYNIAFLNAYDGNLQVAIRHYRQAAMAVVVPDIISQIEDFLCWVLDQEPDKYQLYYCLGFFNWKTKGDVVQADKDFKKFLAARGENEFKNEKDLAEKWLVELHSEQAKLK